MTSPFLSKYGGVRDSSLAPKSSFLDKYGGIKGDELSYTNQRDEEEDEDLFDYMGSVAKYMWNLTKSNEGDGHIFTKAGREQLKANTLKLSDTAAGVTDRIGKFGDQLSSWFSDTPASQMGSEAWGKIKESGSEGLKNLLALPTDPGMIGKALVRMFIETPINAVTQTRRNPDGTPRPSTDSEATQDLLSTIGMVTNVTMTRGIAKTMLPTGKTTGEALKLAAASRSGKMWRAWKANVIGGIPGGAAQGAIEAIGTPDMDKAIVVSALGNLPLSTLFSVLDYKGYVRDLNANKANIVGKSLVAAGTLRAARELEVRAADSFDKMNSKVYGLITGDDAHRAVVASKLYSNEPYIAHGLSPERIVEFEQMMDGLDSQKAKPVDYVPSDEIAYGLNRKRSRVDSVELTFATPLDQAAYVIAGSAKSRKGLSAWHKQILADVTTKTGLSSEAIISHGESLRETAKQAIADPTVRISRTQTELDAMSQQMVAKGKTKIASMAVGETVQDATGVSWIREGDAVVSNNGFRYPLDSREAQLIIGRAELGVVPEAGIIKLGENTWNPVFGRTVETKYQVVKGPNGRTLFTPEITPTERKFFESTGLLKGQEVTTRGGLTGKVVSTDGSKVKIRKGNTYQSVELNDVIPGDTPNVGRVDPIRYVEGVYKSIKAKFKIDKVNDDGFDGMIAKVFEEHQVPAEAREALVDNIFTRLYDDIKSASTPDELAELTLYETLKERFITSDAKKLANSEEAVKQALRASELFLEHNGSKYEVRSLKDGTKIADVGSLEEAYKVAVTSGSPLRPGLINNTQFPTGGFIPGHTTWQPKSGGESTWVDRMFARRGILKHITPTGNMFLRFDAAIKDFTGIDSNLHTVYRSIDDGMIAYRRAIHQLEPATRLYSKALDLKHAIDPSRHAIINGWLEAMDQKEILSSGFGRAATQAEIAFAKALAKIGVSQNDIAFTIHATTKATKVSSIGSQQFGAALDSMIGKTIDKRVVTKEMVQAAKMLNSSPLGQNLSTFSPALAMKLADSYLDPVNSLSRDAYALAHKMSKKEMEVAMAFDDMYKEAAPLLGITADRRITSYSPHMRMHSLLGLQYADPTGSKAFVSDLNRLGVLGNDDLIMSDPYVIAFRYLTGGAKKLSGFDKIEAEGASRVAQIANALMTSGDSNKANVGLGLSGYYDSYIKSALGVPDNTAIISRAFDELNRFFGVRHKLSKKYEGTKLGAIIDAVNVKDPTNTIMSVAEAALQGGRPFFALRDYTTGLMNAYINFGSSFTREALMRGISKSEIDDLISRGVLPSLSIDDFIAPSRAGSLAAGKGLAKRVADKAMHYTYQRQMYNYMAAGIYKTSTSRARSVLSDYVQGKVNFDTVIDKLDLDVHGNAFIRQFNDVMTRGNVDDAAHMLGKWNVKKLVNSWGNGNNPTGWNTSPGRLFGMYGSWGVNEIQTLMDAFSNGSPKKVALRAARFSAVTLGMAAASEETGFDLRSWTINPFKLFPTGGPIIGFATDAAEGATETFNGIMDGELNTDKLNKLLPFTTGESVGRAYIPYSMVAQDWIQAYNLLDSGKTAEGLARGFLGLKEK